MLTYQISIKLAPPTKAVALATAGRQMISGLEQL